MVLSANDPVAAWGGVKLLRERFGIEPRAVTGPSTDNSVGVDIIRGQLNVPRVQCVDVTAPRSATASSQPLGLDDGRRRPADRWQPSDRAHSGARPRRHGLRRRRAAAAHARPPATRARRHRLGQPAWRARRASVPAPRSGLRRPALTSRLADAEPRDGTAASREARSSRPRRTACPHKLIDRPAHCRRRQADAKPRRRRHLCRTSASRTCSEYEACLQAPARRPGAR